MCVCFFFFYMLVEVGVFKIFVFFKHVFYPFYSCLKLLSGGRFSKNVTIIQEIVFSFWLIAIVWCHASCDVCLFHFTSHDRTTHTVASRALCIFAFVHEEVELLFHSVEEESNDICLHIINFTFQRNILKGRNFTVSALIWPPPYDLYEQAAVC